MLWRVSARQPNRRLPPGFIQPCIAIEATKVPTGPGWVHEIKHNGYRMQVRKAGGVTRAHRPQAVGNLGSSLDD